MAALDDTVPTPKLVTSEAPRTDASSAMFARPNLGDGLQQLAVGLDDLATPLAKIQGEQDAASAVTRNPDGSLTVTQHPAAPIFGRPGEAYQQALDTGIVSASRSSAENDLANMATKFQNDPVGFRTAAGAYVDQVKASTPGPAGAMMGQYAQSVADQHTTGLIAQKQRADLTALGQTNDSRVTQLENQMDGLASQGAIASSAFLAAQKERDSILASKVANPAFDYTPAQQKIDDDNFQTRINVSTLTGMARDEAMKTGNVAGALQTLDQGLSKLPISLTQKLSYEGEVTRHLSAMTAIDAQQKQQLSDQADTLRWQAAAHPESVQPKQFDDLSLQLERAKMFPKSAELQNAKLYGTIIAPQIVNGTVADAQNGLHQIEAMASGTGASGSEKQALDYFTSKGWSPVQASGIVGNLVRESGLRAGSVNKGDGSDGSDSIGIGQWNSTRAANLRAFAAAQGKPSSDFQTQLAFIQHELETSEGNAATMLRGAQTPQDAASAFALGYERPAGFMTGDINKVAGGADRVNNAVRIAGGNVSSTPSPGVGPDGQTPLAVRYSVAVEQAQGAFNARAQKLLDGINEADASKMAPTPQELSDLRTMAPDVTGNDLRQKISERLGAAQEAGLLKQMPIAQQQSTLASLQLAGEQGSLPLVQRQILGTLRAQVDQQVSYAKNDPVSLGALRVPAAVAKQANMPAIQPLDASDPASIASGLQARQTWKNVAKQGDPSVSDMVLQPPDIAKIKAQAPSWTGQQAATFLGGIGRLTGPEQETLFANKDFKESVLGLAHSGDPVKMNQAYSLLDAQYRRNPATFQAEDGGKTLAELRTWQTLGQFLPPDEVAKRMVDSSDPNDIKSRDALGKVAEKNLAGIDVGSVVSGAFGSHILGATVPFTTPSDIASPRAGQAMGALLADYREPYIDMYKETGDAKAADAFAQEAIRNKYSASPLNGGRIMAYAPDKTITDPSGAGEVGAYYPKVNGSFDWLQKQLTSDVLNSPFGHAFRRDNSGRPFQYALVSDAKTEADIASKRPPSYQVIALSPADGRYHLVEGEVPGQAMRFRGDPASAQAEATDAFNAQRAADLGSHANDMPDNLD